MVGSSAFRGRDAERRRSARRIAGQRRGNRATERRASAHGRLHAGSRRHARARSAQCGRWRHSLVGGVGLAGTLRGDDERPRRRRGAARTRCDVRAGRQFHEAVAPLPARAGFPPTARPVSRSLGVTEQCRPGLAERALAAAVGSRRWRAHPLRARQLEGRARAGLPVAGAAEGDCESHRGALSRCSRRWRSGLPAVSRRRPRTAPGRSPRATARGHGSDSVVVAVTAARAACR